MSWACSRGPECSRVGDAARLVVPVQSDGRRSADSSWYWDARDMASTKTLNASNLEALGAARLAGLLIEISDGNAATKRRLRLELAGAQSPAELVKEIRKRLATIARSRSFVDWQSRKALVDDLEAQRRAIAEHVAKACRRGPGPDVAVSGFARPVFERSDDSNGTICGIFQAAVADLGEIAGSAETDPKQLGDQVFNALIRNDFGQFDSLIQALKPALGHGGTGAPEAAHDRAVNGAGAQTGSEGAAGHRMGVRRGNLC